MFQKESSAKSDAEPGKRYDTELGRLKPMLCLFQGTTAVQGLPRRNLMMTELVLQTPEVFKPLLSVRLFLEPPGWNSALRFDAGNLLT